MRPSCRDLALVLALLAPATLDAQFDSTRFGAMRWRSLNFTRGGRSVAAVGVPTQPLVYYAGYTGGGVWKTEDAGTTWRNVSDCCFRMGSVGSIAVADSDPNVVYVGMGEHAVRGQSSSWGDGVWKSTDAGRSWTHVGLENSRQIARVLVHPRNDDVVYVAAQGARWAPGSERGIYRTVDGGKSWQKILHASDSAGASELAMDPTNPRILYAAFWQHQRVPWQVRSGGTQGGIYKTTDGGDTWTKLAGGLPAVVGKVGVSVSGANPDRVYAMIEADSGGLFRSEDAGKTWTRVSGDRRLRARAWYYTKVFADPKNADVVYVLNAPILKSIDGGRTFSVLPARHGDNHQLWINPLDNNYLINANDGGVNVSMNGGRTWSPQDNQPTAQIYHVNTDARFPSWVYGAQQDNSTVTISSAFGPPDWRTTAGCENANIAFDPADPRLVYGGCYQGMLEELDTQTGLRRNIQPWPALTLAEPTNEQRYRFNWSAPIITSPHDRRVLYHGGNVLFRSSDRGFTWTPVSPDLTRDDPATQGFGGGPITNEGAGGEVYNTIYAIVESPHAAGTIWVGTDDGLVQLTRDGGKTWTNVTPRGLPPGQVNAIEVSPLDPATAYIAFYRVKWNDHAPYAFRTTDYGRTWTPIVTGLPKDQAVRVVRAGQQRRGVLFAGTETGAWVSFDDGASWRSLQGNLPRVPVTDLQIRNGDLVASTEGRAFWILDDLTPIPQGLDTTTATRLFTPRPAFRAQGVPGALLNFWLGAGTDTASARLEILGANGRVLRTLTGVRRPGLNRVLWNLRPDTLVTIPGVYFFGSTAGYRAPAGQYTVRLTAGGRTYTQPLEVRDDPRLTLTAEERARTQRLAERMHERATEIFRTVRELRDVREQVLRRSRQAAGPSADSVRRLASQIQSRIDSIETALVQVRTTNNQDVINYRGALIDQVLWLSGQLDASGSAPTAPMEERAGEIDQLWLPLSARAERVLAEDVARLNALLTDAPAIVVPARSPVP